MVDFKKKIDGVFIKGPTYRRHFIDGKTAFNERSRSGNN